MLIKGLHNFHVRLLIIVGLINPRGNAMMRATMVTAAFLMAAGAAGAQEHFLHATQVPSTVRSDPKMNVLLYQFKNNSAGAASVGDVMIDREVGVICEALPPVNVSAPADNGAQAGYRCAGLGKDVPVGLKEAKMPSVDLNDIVKRTLHERGTKQIVEISEQRQKDTLYNNFSFRMWNIATREVCLSTVEGMFEADGEFTKKTSQFWGCHKVSNQNSYLNSLLVRLDIGPRI